MGRRIVEYEQRGEERAEYGERLLRKISSDLTTRFGKGFTERNLEHMRLFYLTYREISNTVCARLIERPPFFRSLLTTRDNPSSVVMMRILLK